MHLRFERIVKGLGKYSYSVCDEQRAVGKVNVVKIPKNKYFEWQSDICFDNFIITIPNEVTFGKRYRQNDVVLDEAGNFFINNNRGQIFNCGKKGSNIFNGIYYWEFVIANNIFRAYEVGFGHKGIYFCIWLNDKLVAIVSKDIVSRNFGAGYSIYFEDEQDASMFILICTYWDITRYSPKSSYEVHTLNTWQKDLKNKFDPNFIPKVMRNSDGRIV